MIDIILVTTAALLGGFLWLFRYCSRDRQQHILSQQQGLALHRELKNLLHELQQHRGMCNAFLSGDHSFKNNIDQKQHEIATLMARVNATMNEGQDYPSELTHRWGSIRSQWQQLHQQLTRFEPQQSFQLHTDLIQQLLTLCIEVGEESRLLMDNSDDNLALASVVIQHLPLLTELLGQMRALGTSSAALAHLSTVNAMRLTFLSERIKAASVDVGLSVEALHNRASASLYREAKGHNSQFLLTVQNELLEKESITMQSENYFKTATQAIDANYRLLDHMIPQLDKTLLKRIDVMQQRRQRITAFIFGSLLSMGGIGTAMAMMH